MFEKKWIQNHGKHLDKAFWENSEPLLGLYLQNASS